MEAMLSEFDYFSQQAVQTSVEDEYTVALDPVNAVSQDNPITFEWSGAELTAASLKDSKIMVRTQLLVTAGSLTKADGSDTLGAPVNNLLHSMFESMDLEINGTSVSEGDKLYPYRAYFENMLSYSEDALDTRGQLEGWYWDSPSAFDDYKVTGGTNEGTGKRAKFFGSGRTATMIGRPHLDLFHQERCIPPGCRLKLTLTPSKSKFCTLVKDDASALTLKIASIKFLLRVKRLSTGLALAQEKMVSEMNFRFPYTKVKMHRHTLKSGATSFDLANIFTGQIPSRIIFAIADNAAVSGSNTKNPFNFSGGALVGLYLTVNGDRLPRNGIKLNFGADPANDVSEGYLSMLEALDYDNADKGLGLDPTYWGGGYSVFGFRLTPEPPGSGIWSVPKQGAVDVHLQYSTAQTATSDLIVLSEYPAMLEIDRQRNVITA